MKITKSLLLGLVLLPSISHAQTILEKENEYGNIKAWKVRSDTAYIGRAYTLEPYAKARILFYPSPADYGGSKMVLTGTYTSSNDSVAARAYSRCVNVGGTDDTIFKPNAYLAFGPYGKLFFSDSAECNSIPVYQVVKTGHPLADVISKRTSKPQLWRFMVSKTWVRMYGLNQGEDGKDWLVVDFETPMTLREASEHVARLARDEEEYRDARGTLVTYTSTVDACLLDTGYYRPFILNGKIMGGTMFPPNQSNVIVIN